MPHRNYTCITLHKREYEKLLALARARNTSVRRLVLESIDSYEKALGLRLVAGLGIDSALLWVSSVKTDTELLRKAILNPPKYLQKYLETKEGREVHEYYKARFLSLLEILDKIEDIEKELEKLKKLTK